MSSSLSNRIYGREEEDPKLLLLVGFQGFGRRIVELEIGEVGDEMLERYFERGEGRELVVPGRKGASRRRRLGSAREEPENLGRARVPFERWRAVVVGLLHRRKKIHDL